MPLDPLKSESSPIDEEAQEQEEIDELEKDVLQCEKILKECVDKYGELALECAKSYYNYGYALLTKARSESDVLGKQTEALSKEKGMENGMSDDEEDEEEEDDINGNENGVAANGILESNAADESNSDGEVLNNEVRKAEENEESNDDLECAWEALETARVIYEMQGHSLEKADTIIALCEISLEKEDFSTCIQDYHECLFVLNRLLEHDNRRIAEIWFRMCIAHQLSNHPQEAMECCRNAINICKSRLDKLKVNSDQTNALKPDSRLADDDDASEQQLTDDSKSKPIAEPSKISSDSAEIEELQLLISDLQEKEEEIKEMSLLPSLGDALKEMVEKKMNGESSSVQSKEDSTAGSSLPSSATNSVSVFGAPSNSEAKGDRPVTDLGVLGRGVKRTSEKPLPNSTGTDSSKRRNLEDLLGSGSTVGFDSPK